MTRELFTKNEAEAWLNRRVRALRDFPGVPKGTTGKVIEMEEITSDHFGLIIEWDLSRQGKMLRDWLCKNEFDQHLIEA